jgi:hypothetical protein
MRYRRPRKQHQNEAGKRTGQPCSGDLRIKEACHFNNSFTGLCSNFMIHQKKGGIHAIYRIFMETFG